ncbi:MAG: hypothetical protein NY202_03705 [Mollicutes bacterium UO1]
MVTTLIILISNHNTNKQIGEINKHLGRNIYSFFSSSDEPPSSQSKMANYLSLLQKEEFPDHVKETVKKEIEKITRNALGGQTKENREE